MKTQKIITRILTGFFFLLLSSQVLAGMTYKDESLYNAFNPDDYKKVGSCGVSTKYKVGSSTGECWVSTGRFNGTSCPALKPDYVQKCGGCAWVSHHGKGKCQPGCVCYKPINNCPTLKNGKASKTCTKTNVSNVTSNTCCDGLQWNRTKKRCEAPLSAVKTAKNFDVPQCINTQDGKKFLKDVQVAEDEMDAAVNFFSLEVTASTNRVSPNLSSFKNMNQVIYNALTKREKSSQKAYNAYVAKVDEIEKIINFLAKEAGLLNETIKVEDVTIPQTSPFFGADYQRATVLSTEEGEKAKEEFYQKMANIHSQLDAELKEAQQRGADHVWFCVHEKKCSSRMWEVKSGTKVVTTYHDPLHSLKAPIRAERGVQSLTKTVIERIFSFLKNRKIYQSTFDFTKKKNLPKAGNYIAQMAKEYSVASNHVCLEKPGKQITIPKGKETVVKKLRENAQKLSVYYSHFQGLMKKQAECLAATQGAKPISVLPMSIASLNDAIPELEEVEREDQSLEESVAINLQGGEEISDAAGNIQRAFSSSVGSVASSETQSSRSGSNSAVDSTLNLNSAGGSFALRAQSTSPQTETLTLNHNDQASQQSTNSSLPQGQVAELAQADQSEAAQAPKLQQAQAQNSSSFKNAVASLDLNSQTHRPTKKAVGGPLNSQEAQNALKNMEQDLMDFQAQFGSSSHSTTGSAAQSVTATVMGASGAHDDNGVDLNKLKQKDTIRKDTDELFQVISKSYLRKYPELLSR